MPNFPIGVGIQSFESWSNELDKYKDKINEDTIFVGRSIGPIFAIKYLLKNNLKIKKLVSVSGFNNCSVDGGDYDSVNKTMYVEDLKDFKNFAKEIICIYSKNDPYVKFDALNSFSNALTNNQIVIEDAGHFNADSGYGEKFELLLDKLIN